MKKTILSLGLISIALVACAKPTHNTSDDIKPNSAAAAQTASDAQAPTANTNDVSHSAQTSLDWAGEYKGILPCADCEGIKTELKLNSDKTYELEEEYKGGKGDGSKSKIKGTFTFDSANPSLITLDKAADHRKFFVGENFVEARDIKTGERLSDTLNFKLNKELH